MQQPRVPIRMTEAFTQMLKVVIKALYCIHRSSNSKSRGLVSIIHDTVRLTNQKEKDSMALRERPDEESARQNDCKVGITWAGGACSRWRV